MNRHPQLAYRSTLLFATAAAMAPMLSGCSAIEAVFKAGMWVGVVAIVAVMVVVGGVFALLR